MPDGAKTGSKHIKIYRKFAILYILYMMEKNSVAKKIVISVIMVAVFSVVTWLIAVSMVDSVMAETAGGNEVQLMAIDNGQQAENMEKSQGDVKKSNDPLNGIELKLISGYTFSAKMLIIKDPSRVRLASIYPWRDKGIELHELVKEADAIAGINGGLYFQGRNSGGRPEGVSVSDGEIQYNSPATHGLHLVGLTNDNVLRIIDLTGKKAADVEKIVKEEGIRDAVTFPEERRDESNWFVPIIVDGKERVVKNGLRCCINPRTVVGQRADGAILLMAVNGRGTSAHFGATAVDLIRVMKENGAVNAANLDGGSSTCLYFNGKYEQTSTTLYYAKGSWNLPNAFVVDK